MVVAIGTVSPSAKDTEHSIGTLRALQQLQGTQMSFEEREDILKPKQEVDPWLHPGLARLDAPCTFYRSCPDLISLSIPCRGSSSSSEDLVRGRGKDLKLEGGVAAKGTATSEMLMAEVRQWFEEACGGKAKAFAATISKGTDGKLFRCVSLSADCLVSTQVHTHAWTSTFSQAVRNLLRWPNQRFTQQCEGDEDLGHRLYQEKLEVVLRQTCQCR